MKAKKIFVTLLILCSLLSTANSVYSSSSEKATVADLRIVLNNTVINNINSDYPFLSYKNITYFPMTYDYCNYLGLEINWNKDTGLSINKSGLCSGYKATENTGIINIPGTECLVTIPKYPIKVNGVKINNAEEHWPVIVYRDITYFPLTWRFAVDTFGWSYSWTRKNGLIITCEDAKPDIRETVLSILNQLAFGKGYSFNASIQEKDSPQKGLECSGKVLNKKVNTSFISQVNLSKPFEYKSVKIEGVSTSNEKMSVKNNNGYSVKYSSINSSGAGTAIGPELMDVNVCKMMVQLLKLHYAGSEKKNILSFKKLDTTYGITKWSISDKDRRIEILVDDKETKIAAITIFYSDLTYLITII